MTDEVSQSFEPKHMYFCDLLYIDTLTASHPPNVLYSLRQKVIDIILVYYEHKHMIRTSTVLELEFQVAGFTLKPHANLADLF